MYNLNIAAIALLLILSSDVFAGSRIWLTPRQLSSQMPVISIKEQPDSPLRISSVVNHSTDPSEINLTFTIENISDKPIRAYAVRHEDTCGSANTKLAGTALSILALLKSILQPGQARPEEFSGERCSSAYNTITLSVDFVEFVDGNQWGPDTSNSTDRLSGFKSGTIAESKRLLQIFEERGATAVIQAAEIEISQDSVIKERSEIWNEGFRSGISTIRARLSHLYKEKGLLELEQLLREPISPTRN